jgi:hypothetical protein
MAGSFRRSTERQPNLAPTWRASSALDLVAADKPQLRPVLLSRQDRRLPLPRQILKIVRLEQRRVELSALKIVQLRERWVADDLSTRRLSSALAIGAG